MEVSKSNVPSLGDGVGLGVIGSKPFEVRGGRVKDGGGGEEFILHSTREIVLVHLLATS